MQGSARRALIVIGLCAAILLVALRTHRAGGFAATGEPDITPAVRAATLHFAPGVTPADQAWILGAIANARPEAQRLIAEVDGLVEVRTDLSGSDAIGLAEGGPDGL